MYCNQTSVIVHTCPLGSAAPFQCNKYWALVARRVVRLTFQYGPQLLYLISVTLQTCEHDWGDDGKSLPARNGTFQLQIAEFTSKRMLLAVLGSPDWH